MKFRAHPLQKRIDESLRIRIKYPDRVPVIVERGENANVPDIDKHKFLVPSDLTIGQFIYIIRKRIQLSPEQSLFLFVNDTLPPTGELMSMLYKREKETDGFLYVVYSAESVFG